MYVCKIHQNAKLSHIAILAKTDYKEFFSKFVCNTSNRDGMSYNCYSCPNLNEVEKYLSNLFEESNLGTEDSVKEICNKFNKLRAHHFIAKAQSA